MFATKRYTTEYRTALPTILCLSLLISHEQRSKQASEYRERHANEPARHAKQNNIQNITFSRLCAQYNLHLYPCINAYFHLIAMFCKQGMVCNLLRYYIYMYTIIHLLYNLYLHKIQMRHSTAHVRFCNDIHIHHYPFIGQHFSAQNSDKIMVFEHSIYLLYII